jgi:hypothetical protein
VHYPRFIFLAVPLPVGSADEPPASEVLWMLVSPNNRPLGRGHRRYATYDASRAAVMQIRQQYHRLQATPSVVEAGGRWSWVVDLDGVPVAVSNRSYLRARECSYNLERFMVAVPVAEIVTSIRRPPRAMAAAPMRYPANSAERFSPVPSRWP